MIGTDESVDISAESDENHMVESLDGKVDSERLADIANRKNGDSIENAMHEASAIQQHGKFMENKRGSNLTLPSKHSNDRN